jgi:hypothetical protein
MCTFENKQSVLVCDLAIHQVREAVSAAFGDAIQYTPVVGQGTRVAAESSVDGEAFQAVTRAAIAAAQEMGETHKHRPL